LRVKMWVRVCVRARARVRAYSYLRMERV